MKTALILGAGAIAVYVVWKFGTAAAGPPLTAASAPLAPGNTPYPASPALTNIPNATANALLLNTQLSSKLAAGIISSTTPVASSSNADQSIALRNAGYVIVDGQAYPPGPNAAAYNSRSGAATTSLTAIATDAGASITGGLIAAPAAVNRATAAVTGFFS
jgi:hypothetical protein